MNWGIRRTPTWKKRTIALYCSAALIQMPILAFAQAANADTTISADTTGNNGGNGTDGNYSGTNGGTGGNAGGGGAAGDGSGTAASGGGGSTSYAYPAGGGGGGSDSGGGGGGGSGIFVSGGTSITNNGSILGGNGGGGGSGAGPGAYGGVGNSYFSFQNPVAAGNGTGGRGGNGITATSSTGLTIINNGTIQGGIGGGDYQNAYSPVFYRQQPGGTGILGQNLTITNTSSGTISAGQGVGTAYAIQLTGGTNSITNAGTIGAIMLQGNATTTLKGVYSSSVTLGSGTLQLTGTTTADDVSGITSLDNYGTVTIGAGRRLSVSTFTNENAATLNIGSGATLISTNLNLVAGSTVTGAGTLSAGSNALNFTSGSVATSLGGTGGLVKSGSGTLTLTGANSYTGGTNITGGTLAVVAGALGGGDVHMAQGTTIQFTGSSFTTSNNIFLSGDPTFDVASGTTQTVSGVIADDTSTNPVVPGVVEKTGAGTLVLSGANTYSGGTIIQAGTLQIAAPSVLNTPGNPSNGIASSAVGTGTVTLDGGTLQTTNASYQLYNAITLGAGGGILDTQGGYLTLRGGITGSGGLTIADSGPYPGIYYIASATSFTGSLTVNSGVLQMSNGGSLPAGVALSVNGGVISGHRGSVNLYNSAITVSSLSGDSLGSITNSYGNAQITFAPASGSSTFAGTISDHPESSDYIALVMSGTAGTTQVLSNANSYSGGTTLNSGTLEIGNAGALGSGQIAFNGGTLKADGAYTIANAIQMASGGGTFASGGHNSTFSGNVTDGSTPGALALTGGGTFTFTGSNAFSGGLSLASGTLVANGASNIGSGDITLGSNTTVMFTTVGTTYANNFKLAGSNVFDVDPTGAHLNQTFSGVISDAGSTAASLRIVSDASAHSLQPGTVTLSGANTYSGGTYSYGMGLIANNSSAFGTGTLTLDAAYLQTGLSTLTLDNAIAVTSAGGSIQANGKTIILNGVIGDSGGAGTLTLSNNVDTGQIVLNGANTLSGNTAVNTADIVLGSSSAFGTGTVELYNGAKLEAAANSTLTISNAIGLRQSGGATIILGNGTTLTLSGVISDEYGAGALIVGAGGSADTSTVILSGANSFTGGLTIAGGTVQAANSAALGDAGSAVTMNGGTTLAYANGVAVANALYLTGDVTLSVASAASASQTGDISDDAPATAYTVTKAGAGTLIWSGSNSSSANVRLTSGTLEIGSASALGSGTYIFDGGTLKLDGAYTVSNDILVDNGGGTLAVGANNVTLSGILSEAQGSTGYLSVSGTGSVTITGTNNLTGGTAVAAGGVLTVANAFALGSGTVAMGQGSTIAFTTGSSSFANAFQLDGDPSFDVASGITTTLTGVISDMPSAAPGVVEKTGAGTLVLSGANTYSGGTVISAGTLMADNASALGGGGITLDGGTLGWTFAPTVTNAIALTANGGSIRVDDNTIALNGVISDMVSGAGALNLVEGENPGIVILAGANTFTGGTVIGHNVYAVAGGASAFGTGAIVLNGGVLTPLGQTSLTLTNAIKVSSTGGIIEGNGTTFTVSGTISDQDPAHPGLLMFGSGGSGDSSTVVVSGSNSYTGGTLIGGGTVKVSGSSALGAASGAVEMASGTSLAMANGASLGNAVIFDDTTPTITVASGSATLGGGVQELTGTPGGFTKTGSGTLVLTGASGNTGATVVSAGTLEIGDGAGSALSAYQVASGATLSFDSQTLGYAQIGSLAGAGTVNAGTELHVGGNGANSDDTTLSGTITSWNLTYNGGGTLTLTGTGNNVSQLVICACVTSGGIAITGGDTTASGETSVGAGTLTVSNGAVLNTGTFYGNGFTSVSGTGSSIIAGMGLVGGASQNIAVTQGGYFEFTNLNVDAGGVTVSGAGSKIAATSSVDLGYYANAALTVADGAVLDTPNVSLNLGSKLIIGDGTSAAGTIGTASTFISTGDAQYADSGVVANFTGTGTLDARMSGAISLAVQKGDLTLTNILNDYSGGTTIAQGAVLTIQNNSVGTGAIVTNGVLVVDNASDVTMTNAISGTGSVTQAGNGKLTFNTAQTYAGVTTVAGNATLFLTGAGDLSHSSQIVAHGTFDVSGVTGQDVAITSLSGDGDVEIGAKTLTITGNGGIFSGMLSDGGQQGDLVLTGDQILNGIVSITGTTTIGSDAIVTVSTPDALGGGALDFQAGSILKFGGSGTFGNAMHFQAHAPVFDVTGQQVTLSGLISGPGDLAVTGAGTLTLTNAGNSYAGGTEVYGGSTLRVDADGELGAAAPLQLGDATSKGTLQYAGAFALASGRAITVNAGGGLIDSNGQSVTIASAIGGTGPLTKTGAGTLTLTGTSTLTGATTVGAGTLAVNGSLAASAVTVASGASLTGTGTVGATSVASGGTIAPATGTLHVNGDLTLASGSITAISLSPGGAGQIAVSGTANLGGSLALTQGAGSYTAGSDYKLVSAASVNGVFSSVSGLGVTGLNANIVYSAAAADLVLTAPTQSGGGSNGGSVTNSFLFGTYGVTANQVAAGTALAAGSNAGTLYTAMGNLVVNDRAAVPGALGALAGDIHASLRGAAIEDSRLLRNSVMRHLDGDADGLVAWGTAFGGYGSIAGDGNATGLHHDSAGFVAGADMGMGDGLRLGLAAAYTNGNARTADHSATADGGSGHVLAYASWRRDALDIRLGGDLGWGRASVTRAVSALSQSLSDHQDTRLGQVFAQAGYRIQTDQALLEPYVGLTHIAATTGGFSESGGSAALAGQETTDSKTFASLGMRANMAGAFDDPRLTPWSDIAFRHGFGRLRPAQGLTLVDAGQSFAVMGAPLDIDSAAVQAGLDFALTPQAVLSLGYDGSFGARTQSNGLKGGLAWRF